MALIVLQHSVVDNFDVDPDMAVNNTTRILQGSIVGLNADGFLSRPGTTINPLGLAGDSISDEYKTTAYSSELVISPGRKRADGSYTASKRYTAPRVSDYFNETSASNKMTVYFGAGRFATDQYVPGDTYVVGAKLYANAAGLFTTTVGSGALAGVVGRVVGKPSEYPSGVTGSDAPSTDGNSMSLGQYLTVHLNIA